MVGNGKDVTKKSNNSEYEKENTTYTKFLFFKFTSPCILAVQGPFPRIHKQIIFIWFGFQNGFVKKDLKANAGYAIICRLNYQF